MRDTLEYFNYVDADPWAESSITASTTSGMVFTKEALPVGSYRKEDGDASVEFDVTRRLLANIVKNHNKMIANGIGVPYQMGHEGDGNQLGKVVGASIRKNLKGLDSLFLDVEFADEDAKVSGLRHDVSVHVPSSFTDSKRNTYNRPLRHLAGTSYPVVAGLENWQPITASFISEEDKAMVNEKEEEKKKANTMQEIAEALSLTFEEGEEEDEKKRKVLETIGSLQDENGAFKAKKKAAEEEEEPVVLSHNVMRTLKGARELVLSNMVGKNITPAVKDELVKQFCGNDAITLSFSATSGSNGDFENIVKILEKNTCVPCANPDDGDITYSHGGGKKSPMDADIERRIEEAKQFA